MTKDQKETIMFTLLIMIGSGFLVGVPTGLFVIGYELHRIANALGQ